MDTVQPYVNLLVLLTVLSLIAERATNMLKLRNEKLRTASKVKEDEKVREEGITRLNIAMGILVAVLVKANLFEIMSNLGAPWETLGWVRITHVEWVRADALSSLGTALYAIGGSMVTGIGLGFGSKFWHDMLDIVFQLRGLTARLRQGGATGAAGEAGDG